MDDLDAGTAVEETVAPAAEATASDETAATTETTTGATAKPDESFIPFEKFPPDVQEQLRPHYQRMQSAYTKGRQAIAADREAVDLVKQFRENEDFARQLIISEAARLGLTINGAATNGTETKATTPASTDQPPAELVERIKARLAPELQWMAPQLAAANWDAHRALNAPREKQDLERQKAERVTQYQELASKLSDTAPGWEEHESDMHELLGFLQSPALTHRKFGSKLDLLFHAVTRGASAEVGAIRRMGEAAKSATRTGQSGRSTISNVADRVRKADNTRDAMAIAAEEAERDLRARGVPVPD